ncbi:MAG: 4-hydroxyacetophenone monooxygenase, partial [Candidatus Eremiobacteraeota bacterium]|nr:4-hydroxyacetophenone monooxygenase [Candidatus Eremiobacteraeota bacterium]
MRAIGFTVDPSLLEKTEKLARRHLARQIPDPILRAKVEPEYRMGCKRVLIS